MKPETVIEKLAFDKSSVRERDQNGHLHVSMANISKANVCPYFGREIPGWKELGLDSNRVYMMLRHPDELEKAAETFNGSPLLDNHTPVSAWDHPFGKVVGATGNDAVFDGTYLKNSLVVWPADAIERIESNEQKEISCSYTYTPDMTPGTYQGQAYDGVMRDIKANHVALVAQGRAGSDVVVADSINPKMDKTMKKKYSIAILSKLAQDNKIDNLADLMALLAKDEEAEKEKVDDEETDEEKEARLKKEAEEKKKAEDEEESEAEAKREEEAREKKDDKAAMDAAIAQAEARVKADMKALHEAEEVVRPWVGKLAAQDSAADVYKAALALKGITVDGVHPSAYRAICEAHMKAESRPVPAMDAKTTNDFTARFPGAARIKRA